MNPQTEMTFDGRTYDPALDKERLSSLLAKVYWTLRNHPETWFTLSELYVRCGGSEAGLSARLRDLRKAKFGSHVIAMRRRGDPKRGIFEYRLADPTPTS